MFFFFQVTRCPVPTTARVTGLQLDFSVPYAIEDDARTGTITPSPHTAPSTEASGRRRMAPTCPRSTLPVLVSSRSRRRPSHPYC